jgi:hypothetical protein
MNCIHKSLWTQKFFEAISRIEQELKSTENRE